MADVFQGLIAVPSLDQPGPLGIVSIRARSLLGPEAGPCRCKSNEDNQCQNSEVHGTRIDYVRIYYTL